MPSTRCQGMESPKNEREKAISRTHQGPLRTSVPKREKPSKKRQEKPLHPAHASSYQKTEEESTDRRHVPQKTGRGHRAPRCRKKRRAPPCARSIRRKTKARNWIETARPRSKKTRGTHKAVLVWSAFEIREEPDTQSPSRFLTGERGERRSPRKGEEGKENKIMAVTCRPRGMTREPNAFMEAHNKGDPPNLRAEPAHNADRRENNHRRGHVYKPVPPTPPGQGWGVTQSRFSLNRSAETRANSTCAWGGEKKSPQQQPHCPVDPVKSDPQRKPKERGVTLSGEDRQQLATVSPPHPPSAPPHTPEPNKPQKNVSTIAVGNPTQQTGKPPRHIRRKGGEKERGPNQEKPPPCCGSARRTGGAPPHNQKGGGGTRHVCTCAIYSGGWDNRSSQMPVTPGEERREGDKGREKKGERRQPSCSQRNF